MLWDNSRNDIFFLNKKLKKYVFIYNNNNLLRAQSYLSETTEGKEKEINNECYSPHLMYIFIINIFFCFQQLNF